MFKIDRLFIVSILVFILNFPKINSKTRHFKIFKADVRGFEPYANVSYFKLRPVNRYISEIDVEGFLKHEYKNGYVRVYKLQKLSS